MKTIIGLLIVFVFCGKVTYGDDLLSKFHQNEYKIRDFRAEVVSFDDTVIKFFEIKTFKYNGTTPMINASAQFKIDLGDKTEIAVQLYKFLSNEYRYFPIRFQVNLKKALTANIAGLSTALSTCGNIKTFEFYKDITYYVCNFAIDATHLPPLMPNGRYKAEIQYIFLNRRIATENLYVEVYTPI